MEDKDINLEEAVNQESDVEIEAVEEEIAEDVKAAELPKDKEGSKDKEDSKDKEGKPVKEKRFGNKKSSKSLELELKKKDETIEELSDKYKRLMAEFENARKRTQKESSRMYDVGAKEVLEKLLPVVDNFERGLAAIPEEEKESAFTQGFDKIYKQLMVSLDEVGVKPMLPVGTEFNPDLHNAVMHTEDEELGENIVAEEFQKGYMYKEMVLRHSMVKVVN